MQRYLLGGLLVALACGEEPTGSVAAPELDTDCPDAQLMEWYADADGDGAGDPEYVVVSCTHPGTGWVENSNDCADDDPDRHPQVDREWCNELDDDCDGEVDEEPTVDPSVWYLDADYDEYGVPDVTMQACARPIGYAANPWDCDDNDTTVHPDQSDHCNGIDDDCDDLVDEDHKEDWLLLTIDQNTDSVYVLDPVSAQPTLLLPMVTSGMMINTMDIHPDGHGVAHDQNNSGITTIDVCAGTAQFVGPPGITGNYCGLAYGPAGRLFGLEKNSDRFVEFDMVTGVATEIGHIGFDSGNCGLTYDCSTDTLYAADAQTNQVYSIDPATGLGRNFVSTDVPFSSVGLDFDPVTQTLLASDGSSLWRIVPETGETSAIGLISHEMNIDDLALHPECP